MKGSKISAKLCCSVVLCWLFNLNLCAEQNQLCKIFHHDVRHGNNGSDSQLIEVGKVVFYFDKSCAVRLVSDKNMNGKRQLNFLFPATEIKPECVAMLEVFRSSKNQWYVVNLERVKSPTSGLNFSILFDPEVIEITHDTFDSISLYKGLVFTLYDKKLLERMKLQTNPLTRLASSTLKPHVIIDCGHGGSDTGAVGCDGVQEKDLTLMIGLNVASLLKERGIASMLTRDRDMFVALDQRTCMQGIPSNSIFISLHINFAENQNAAGLETFCLSPPLLKRNFKTMDDYSIRLIECVICDKYKKSQMLATHVHNNLMKCACKKNPGIIDRHVKYSVSQVLLGSFVPSILVELGFISNKHESMLLQSQEYQRTLAKGICNGVLYYFNNL